MEEMMKVKLTDQQMAGIMGELDTNGDGSIDFDEFAVFVASVNFE
jgi:Ca2+-binding EF-hand superfamily protein